MKTRHNAIRDWLLSLILAQVGMDLKDQHDACWYAVADTGNGRISGNLTRIVLWLEELIDQGACVGNTTPITEGMVVNGAFLTRILKVTRDRNIARSLGTEI